jgi:8-oxo-dGTP pyrophosphatase MutT (NUDIX family)
MYRGEILLLKRSDEVTTYRGLWNTVAGYLDEARPLSYKVKQELEEELHITPDKIQSMETGEVFEIEDDDIGKTWIVHPVLIQLKERPTIKLDWEHTEYKWIPPETIGEYDVVPDLDKSFNYALETKE